MSERRTLFLHTQELDDTVCAAMLEAGYLPVRVADVKECRLIEHSVSLSRDQLDAIGRAALRAVAEGPSSNVRELFISGLAKELAKP